MGYRNYYLASVGGTAFAAMAVLASPVQADAIDDLKAQIEALSQKVETLEREQEKAPKIEDVVTKGDFPRSYKLPGTDTSIRLGGYVKGDFIFDFAAPPAAGGGDFAVISSAPLEGSTAAAREGEARFHAKESRINVETRTPTEVGRLRTFIEGDFFDENNSFGTEAAGNKTSFGLRHAYGELGPLLAGQTWTNFMDITAYGEKVDFTGPAGRTFIRQAQFRYTQKLDSGDRFAIALENPNGDFNGSGDSNFGDKLPDLTGNYRVQGNRWHLQFNGMLRQISTDDGVANGLDDETVGWAVGMTGQYFLPESKDRISWYTVYGDGVGRYLEGANGLGASLDASGNLSTQTGYGGFATYRHWWSDSLRSNVVGGVSIIDTDANALATANEEIYSVYANLIWSPVSSVDIGVEYIYGMRKVKDGREGDVSRLQVGTKYRF